MLGRTDSRPRLLFLLICFGIGSLALVARTAYWQVGERDWLMTRVEAQTTMRWEQPGRRGEIYDRTGVVLLATTVERERVVAATRDLDPTERERTTATLIDILGLEDPGAIETLQARMATQRPYVIVARDVEPRAADRIRAAAQSGRVVGITLEPEPVRVYPQVGGGPDSTLAAHLLGFVNREAAGQYGVEQYYQAALAGSPRVMTAQRGLDGRARPGTAVVERPGAPGEDLRLTIDAGLQLALEQELLAAWIADKAKSVSAVVMDPYTGEVYAMGTYPSYDANDYIGIAETAPNRFIDPVVSKVYEPGSVFKMMTAAAALETGTVDRLTKIKDVGTLELDGGRTKIDNADRKGMGSITFEEGFAYSRNVVAAKVALDLGEDGRESAAILYDMWMRLGYGVPTGIDVSGEVGGIVRDPGLEPWREIDLANAAFGQGVAVTPIQLAKSYATVLNGGAEVHPHVVKSIGPVDVTVPPGRQIIDPAISNDLRKLADHVVEGVPFYRDRTIVPGYHVGGKTGTAQIWDSERGRWKHNLFNYTFVGYIAREPKVPDLIVAVRIEEGTPTVARVGQLEMPVMSFELFRRIATDAITTPDLLAHRPVDRTDGVTDR